MSTSSTSGPSCRCTSRRCARSHFHETPLSISKKSPRSKWHCLAMLLSCAEDALPESRSSSVPVSHSRGGGETHPRSQSNPNDGTPHTTRCRSGRETGQEEQAVQ
jgi:hypothetical protein